VVELLVIDLVDDPDEIVAQLSKELNLGAEVLAVPVADHMIGAIIAVGSLGSLEPTIDVSANGTVERILLPEDGEGPLIFEYGRRAESGETYAASSPDASCADLYLQPVDRVQAQLREVASSVRYELINANGTSITDIALSELPEGSIIVRTSFLDAETVLLEVAIETPTEPPHPNCEPR